MFICWHIADGTYNGTISWEKDSSSRVSSHFVLGKNGEVAQLVPLDMAAWTQGGIRNPTHPYVKSHLSVNPNQYCVSIECEGFWKETKGKLTDAQFNSAVELTKHIVSEVKKLYNVDIPIDREHMIGHCEINTVTRSHCPGELFPFDELIALARGEDAETVQDETASLPYTVQCGAFASANNASALKDKLSARGYYCYLTDHLGTLRVCVGKFATKEEAAKTAGDLNRKGFAGFVTTI
nr:MAG TPA_asm: N-acetyl-anhydromuramyl-L-alanine amidase [Caudoviricetes sp.]